MTDAVERGAENDVRGTLAQDEFKTWCTVNDLTANRATEDKEGWDFFVEFKSSNEPRPFLDHAPPTAKALVQVKASADPEGEFRMTLSNARKLVTGHPGPAFVFVAHLESRELKKTWLVHCGSDFIERVLRALAEDSSKPLNDRVLTFRPTLADEVTRTTLRSTIETGVGDTRTYEQRKRQMIETVGYDAHKYTVKVRHGTGTQEQVLQDIVDLVLGLREITVESISINDARFSGTRPLKEIRKPVLSSPTSEDAPSVALTFETETERAELQFRALVGALFVPNLPAHLNKTRLVSPCIDIVIGGDRDVPPLDATVSVEDDRQVIDASVSLKRIDAPLTASNLAARAKAAKVARLLADPTCRIVFRRSSDAEHVVLGFGGSSFDRYAIELLKVIEDYHTILEHYGIPPEAHPVGPEALLQFGQTLHVFASMARGNSLDAELRFPKAEPPPGVAVGDQVSFVAGAGLKFPCALLFVVNDITGRVQSVDEMTCRVVSRTGRPLSHRVFLTRPTLEDLSRELFRAGEQLEARGHEKVFILPPRDDIPSTNTREPAVAP